MKPLSVCEPFRPNRQEWIDTASKLAGIAVHEAADLYWHEFCESLWFANDVYRVALINERVPIQRLRIEPIDGSTRHVWKEFQQIKNQIFGIQAECVELYPSELRLVDTANVYHLWTGLRLPSFGWNFRAVR